MGKARTIARRTFLIGSAAIAGGVVIGYYKYRKGYPNPLITAEGQTALNPYLIIDQDGFTIVTPRAEMGQGVHSTLAAMVAEELDVPWDGIKTIHGPASKAYHNETLMKGGLPFNEYSDNKLRDFLANTAAIGGVFLGLAATGGSTSTKDGFFKMRKAGAAARIMLLQAAAETLDVAIDELRTEDGYVVAGDGTRLRYQQLASDAASFEPQRNPPLKDPSQWRYLGKSMPRLDMAAKVDGSAMFGIDTRRDGMLYAAIRTSPVYGANVKSFDAANAEGLPGVSKVVDLGDAVAIIATDTWRALQAAEKIDVTWGDLTYPDDMDGIYDVIARSFDKKANATLRNDGDVDAALQAASNRIEAEYRAPYLAHACMEPMNATALYTGDSLEIWTGTQAPTSVLQDAAQTAGLEPEQVRVHTLFLGGGFGRRAEVDASNYAVRLAMAMPGIPIKLTYSRQDDMRKDYYRPATIARMQGAVDESGPTAFKASIAGQSVYREQGRRLLGMEPPGADRQIVEGAFDQPYGIENYQVGGYPFAELPIPIGAWRSVGNSHNGFFHECFMDELARAGGFDPVEMRLKLMRNVHEPSRLALEAVAEMANWGRAVPPDQGRGVAFTFSFGAATAQIVDVLQTEQGIKIDKVWCAMDVGMALDPRNIEAQVMSGIIFGLSAAVFGEITFKRGQVVQSNFHNYDALRMHNSPEIETRILQNNHHMSGVGEPGTPPSMPALANAVFDLTGQRIRELPLNKSIRFI